LQTWSHPLTNSIAGNKEFGIPPLEPLTVKKLVIDAGNAPINLRQALKNVKVHDMISTSKIQRYRWVITIKIFINEIK